MKTTRIICAVIPALLFWTAVQASCLSPQQTERKNPAVDEHSKGTQPQSQQRPPQGPRQPQSPSQPPPQARPQPPNENPQQPHQNDNREQHERTQERQPPPQKPQDQSGARHSQQPDTRNQDSQHPQDFERNRPQQPSDQQHGQQGSDDRNGRDDRRPGYHQDNERDHHNDWQGRRARDWRSDHRTWEQRGGYHGYRIPELWFGRYFGPGRFFRIHDLPVVVLGGYPRFLYCGYWFSLVDPWPEYWADDWYETDDVYIVDSGDGYYLFNRRYPGEGIAVSVSM
jgi:hypothetical protein